MSDRSCWTCGWNRLGGNTLMGVCGWFFKSKGIFKEIPKNICDKGCKFWVAEKQDFGPVKEIKEEEIW